MDFQLDNLFKKLMWFSDSHFGRQNNSPIANQDNLDFLEWAIDRAKSWGADSCIFGGDWFDNRYAIGLGSLDAGRKGLEALNAAFKRTYLIIGNHDLLHKEKRDIASVEFGKHLPNINIIKDPCEIDGVTLLPWLVGDEPKMIRDIKSRYVFAHLAMGGFMMNAKAIIPNNENLIQPDQFDGVEMVVTGHYHARQRQGRVVYGGNIMGFDYASLDDPDRGIMLLQWGKEPVFEAWAEQPLFSQNKLSVVLTEPSLLKPKMTLRLEVDIPLEFGDLREIRDELVETYDLRRVELLTQTTDDVSEQGFKDENIAYKSVDQLVIEGLNSIDSNGISKERLVELYKNLVGFER